MCKMLNENSLIPRKDKSRRKKTLRVYTLHSKIENYAMRVNKTATVIHTNRISGERTGRNSGS